MNFKYEIKQISPQFKEPIIKISEKEWGSKQVVSLGKLYEVDILPGFVAVADNKLVGFVTYSISNNECEIITLFSEIENKGIGSSLIESVKKLAQDKHCSRLKLMTTNDNIRGIEFYQKRGFSIAKVYVDGIKKSRKLKPQIPLVAENGIPIRDEIEFEIKL